MSKIAELFINITLPLNRTTFCTVPCLLSILGKGVGEKAVQHLYFPENPTQA